jgi:hypothetical protein
MNHLSRCAGVVVDLRVSTRRSLILCCLLCVDWELDHDRKTGATRPPTFAARSLCLSTLLLAVAALTLISPTFAGFVVQNRWSTSLARCCRGRVAAGCLLVALLRGG